MESGDSGTPEEIEEEGLNGVVAVVSRGNSMKTLGVAN